MRIRRVVSVCAVIAAMPWLGTTLSFAEPGDPDPIPQKTPAAARGADRTRDSATDVRVQPGAKESSTEAPHPKPGTNRGGSATLSGPGSGVGGVP